MLYYLITFLGEYIPNAFPSVLVIIPSSANAACL